MTRSGRSSTGTEGGSWLRRLAWASMGLFAVCVVLAGLDLRAERRRAIEAGDAAMGELARIAEALREADESRIHALLARLRIELRSSGLWTALEPAGEDRTAAAVAAARQRDNLLRRAIEGSDDVRTVELVVAGPKGLVSATVGAEGAAVVGGVVPTDTDAAAEADARAKSRWFSAVVQAAVEANGQRLARGSILQSEEGGGADAAVEVVLAVHDAEDLVQGVLIATIDLEPLARRLGSLASATTRFALVLSDGTSIAPSLHAPRGSIEALRAGAAPGSAEAAAIVEGEDLRSLLMPLSNREGDPIELAYWLERDAPPALAAAALRSAWAPALIALLLLTGTLLAWDRDRARASTAPAPAAKPAAGPREGVPTRVASAPIASAASDPERATGAGDASGTGDASGADSDPLPVVRPERFVLRDWLADVRGCLEREAATRGLTLVLRCERALPREIEQDPLWLGGLLVSLGREALDATSSSRVALEVTDEGGDRLRFELDAGDTELASATGMRAIAGRLGATLEGPGRGRIAVVVPLASAA